MRPPAPEPVAAARRVLEDAGVRGYGDIDVEAIAARNRAYVCYGKLDTARGSIVRTERSAVIWIDERLRGTPRGRFTIAHELGHHKLHKQVDHFRQCEGEPKKHEDFVVEREASHFSSELVMPEALTAPLCTAPRPTLDDVARIARRGLSFQSAAIRYVELAKAPCAVALFEKRGDAWRVQWGPESEAFPGRVVLRRAPPDKSMAAEIIRRGSRGDVGPREVPAEAWAEQTRTKKPKRGAPPFVEHAIHFGSTVMSWIIPAG